MLAFALSYQTLYSLFWSREGTVYSLLSILRRDLAVGEWREDTRAVLFTTSFIRRLCLVLIEPLTLTKIKKKGHKADQDYNIYLSLPLPFYSSLVKRLVTLQALCVLIVSSPFFFFPASLLLEELQGESV